MCERQRKHLFEIGILESQYFEIPSDGQGPKFDPGVITASETVKEQFGAVEICKALIRHVQGDWGNVTESTQSLNEFAVEMGAGAIESIFRDEQERVLRFVTKLDRGTTEINAWTEL